MNGAGEKERPVRSGSPEGLALAAFLAFTLLALLGYGLFGVQPERLPEVQVLRDFWRISFGFFAQVHILLGGAVLGILLVRKAGFRWVPALLAVYLVSFLSEFAGTGYGVPFGRYEYTTLLGAKLGGRVPWVIPLSWFLMVIPSYALARRTFPEPGRPWTRIGFAAVILVLWDLALDPAMSYQAPYYWRWIDTGPYYGMPWINLAGWLGTGFVLMAAVERMGGTTWVPSLPVGWLGGYYGITLLMPLGMLVLEGLWLAVGITLLGYASAFGLHFAVVRGRESAPASIGMRSVEEGG
jgi:uncharacterized membrane protein